MKEPVCHRFPTLASTAAAVVVHDTMLATLHFRRTADLEL